MPYTSPPPQEHRVKHCPENVWVHSPLHNKCNVYIHNDIYVRTYTHYVTVYKVLVSDNGIQGLLIMIPSSLYVNIM